MSLLTRLTSAMESMLPIGAGIDLRQPAPNLGSRANGRVPPDLFKEATR